MALAATTPAAAGIAPDHNGTAPGAADGLGEEPALALAALVLRLVRGDAVERADAGGSLSGGTARDASGGPPVSADAAWRALATGGIRVPVLTSATEPGDAGIDFADLS